MDQKELRRLAQIGAAVRLGEIEEEQTQIKRAFPELGTASTAGHKPRSPRPGELKARKKRRGMSAAARKAVSVRMTKYWAARRKAKK